MLTRPPLPIRRVHHMRQWQPLLQAGLSHNTIWSAPSYSSSLLPQIVVVLLSFISWLMSVVTFLFCYFVPRMFTSIRELICWYRLSRMLCFPHTSDFLTYGRIVMFITFWIKYISVRQVLRRISYFFTFSFQIFWIVFSSIPVIFFSAFWIYL